MSAEQVGTADAAMLDTALRGLRDTLEADGYSLDWSVEDRHEIAVRVLAGPDACADCLVPIEIMRTILSDALSGTPYRVGPITLPTGS